MRRAIALLAAAAAVVAFSFATPALACDGEKKAEAAAVVAKAENGKAVTAEAKGGCGHAAAAEMAAVDANGKPVVVKASAEGEGKAGCAKAAKGGCGAKKGTAATLAKAEEPKADEAKTK